MSRHKVVTHQCSIHLVTDGKKKHPYLLFTMSTPDGHVQFKLTDKKQLKQLAVDLVEELDLKIAKRRVVKKPRAPAPFCGPTGYDSSKH